MDMIWANGLVKGTDNEFSPNNAAILIMEGDCGGWMERIERGT